MMEEFEKEKMIQNLELDIRNTKEYIRRTEGNGWPLILGVTGLVLSVVIIGIPLIIIAIFWAWDRSKKNSHYRSELQEYEKKLFTLQKSKMTMFL